MTTTIESTTRVFTGRLGRTLGRAGLALAIGAGALAVGSSAEAVTPRNELADEINAAADLAVVAHDDYVASDDLADFLTYARHRTATARLAARELGYDEFAFVNAWKDTPLSHQRAVLAAMTQVGVPYRSHTSVEDEGFDCSGLTYYAWSESGTELFRQSGSQINAAQRLSIDEAKAGDLVHYPGHVMMYLGVADAVVHSVQTGRTVEIDTISDRRINSVRFGDPTG